MKEFGSEVYAAVKSNHLKHPFNAAMVKKWCCGHRCPVCGNPARPLCGFCKDPNLDCEADVPWRFKIGRIAHKCYAGKHRFDIDSNTGKALPEYVYKFESSRRIRAKPAGSPQI